MSENKDLNVEELEKVTGGFGSNYDYQNQFHVGDWIKEFTAVEETVYYVKEVLDNRFYLIMYVKSPLRSKDDSRYTVTDIGYQPMDSYKSSAHQKLINHIG